MCILKNGRPVSRVLYSPPVGEKPLSFILSRHCCRDPCSLPLLTPGVQPETNRAVSLSSNSFSIRIYLALQPARCTADHVATVTGGLLPHLFTLVPSR